MKRLQSARQTTVTEVRMLAADPYITKRYMRMWLSLQKVNTESIRQ